MVGVVETDDLKFVGFPLRMPIKTGKSDGKLVSFGPTRGEEEMLQVPQGDLCQLMRTLTTVWIGVTPVGFGEIGLAKGIGYSLNNRPLAVAQIAAGQLGGYVNIFFPLRIH